MKSGRAAWLLLALPLAGCQLDDATTNPGDGVGFIDTPFLTYQWVDDGWENTQPLGHPSVEVSWSLPNRWNGEVFRVYARRSGTGNYLLAATVTSCSGSRCVYADPNVESGRSYDYYVASLDERSGRERDVSEAVRIDLPAYQVPDTPAIDQAVGLDGAVWLRWESTGAESYRVFLERIDADSVFYEVGSSDGVGYVDTRAENGSRFGYRIAAVDSLGHVSARSALATGIARPDYHADLLYPLSQSADSSGFRFVSTEADSPTVPGTAPNANWRFEVVGGVLSIVPLNGATVTPGRLTSALTCGPGSESDCVSIDQVGSDQVFGSAPVPVRGAHSYVFRVGAGSALHYGKVRVVGTYPSSGGRSAIIFDWSYQLIPGEPSLSRTPTTGAVR
jgi:hypothetical protein